MQKTIPRMFRFFGPRSATKWIILHGGSQTGASTSNCARSCPAYSGIVGADFKGQFQGLLRLFGADWDKFLHASSHGEKSRDGPESGLLAFVGAFWANSPLAKPAFGFPRMRNAPNLAHTFEELLCCGCRSLRDMGV